MKTLFVLTLLLCISIAYGLKCYTCSSSSSMDDCKSKQKEADCLAGSDRCAKTTMEYGSTKSYLKLCMAKVTCDNSDLYLKVCKAISGAKCTLDCCEGDLCNSGTAPMVSVLLMMACVILALFR